MRFQRSPWQIAVSAAVLLVAVAGSTALVFAAGGHGGAAAPEVEGMLDPASIPKYQAPMIIPPAMPRTDKIKMPGGKSIDYYEIAVRQFEQQILPASFPPTTVWSYGSVNHPGTFNYPAFTIEAKWKSPVRVKWINELVRDPLGCFYGAPGAAADACSALPHLLPVDQTLHWANPPGDCKNPLKDRDCRGTDPETYTGPVPMIVHVHGAETTEDSDGYPEAWYLPAADDIPADYVTGGSFFETFRDSSAIGDLWTTGATVFEYPNDQEATTLWYHDHTLGMTRQNVYAGPAGFFLLRGGPGDEVAGWLPEPAPALGDRPGLDYYEIPVVVQDRSFNEDGSLYYPDNRAFFEGLLPDQLQIPFIPDDVVYPDGTDLGPSDVSPIWNPEFFGNAIVVNGRTWPFLEVEQRRYRLRLLNGSQSRFLILRLSDGAPFWQIGAEQGFLPAPAVLNELLMAPAERADVIVDFGDLPVGATVTMINLGPDEPFGGGTPWFGCETDPNAPADCFEPADPMTTGEVMQFRVVRRKGPDKSTPPDELILPPPPVLGPAVATRRISLNEEESKSVLVAEDEDGNIVLDLDGEVFGPTEALLGTVNPDGSGNPLTWSEPTTENVAMPGDTEVWEIFNYTADAHPIHIHLVQFQVVDRQALDTDVDGNPIAVPTGDSRGPESWETGFKDTVIAYPGEVTRVKAMFPLEGLFVWHCHILEHEDNEMMRPYCVGNSAACQQHNDAPLMP